MSDLSTDTRRRAEQRAGREHVREVVRDAFCYVDCLAGHPDADRVAVRIAEQLAAPHVQAAAIRDAFEAGFCLGVERGHDTARVRAEVTDDLMRGDLETRERGVQECLDGMRETGRLAPVLSDPDRAALNYLLGWANASIGDVTVERERFEAGVTALERLLAGFPTTGDLL